MSSEISLTARKQNAMVYSFTDEYFPSSPVKMLQNKPHGSESTQDPQPILDVAYKILRPDTTYSLHDALELRSKRDCRQFLNSGQKDLQDADGDTPVHVAIRLDWLYACTLILKKNPNLLLENTSQQTPIELAEDLCHHHLIVKLLQHAITLDAVVPKARQFKFLSALWYHGNVEAISLVAKQYIPKSIYHSWVYNFSEESLQSLGLWIKMPKFFPGLVKFSFTRKDWELILYHFIGKKALLFAKDRKHLYEGSHQRPMDAITLWTWRNFWQTQGPSNSHLYEAIDKAIGAAINPPSSAAIAKKIQEGIEPVIIPTGWEKHSVAVVFIGSLLFICNRGEDGLLQTHDLTAYRIKRTYITKELVRQIKSSEDSSKSTASAFLFGTLPHALGAKVDAFCQLIHTAARQPPALRKPICTAASLRLAIHAILLSQAPKQNGCWDFSTPVEQYEDYVLSARLSILNKYLEASRGL